MKAYLTGIGWVNSTGRGQGRKAVFHPGVPGEPLKLTSKGIFDKPIPRFGRMDEYSKLGVAAISMALKDARLDHWTQMRNIALIASTVYGCLSTDADYFDTVMPDEGRLASPNLFAYTLPNTYIGEAAILFGLTGASFIIQESAHPGRYGLLLAMECLSNKNCEAAVIGICDTRPPEDLGLKYPVVPGALFLVLQKGKEVLDRSYGTLVWEDSGNILYEGKRVEELQELAVWCTKK